MAWCCCPCRSAACTMWGRRRSARASLRRRWPRLQFNVLCTTYEYIMRDRTKLAKVDACNPRTLMHKEAHQCQSLVQLGALQSFPA